MSNKKEAVIVADDDPRLLRLVQFNLQQAGYRVLTAPDGSRALRLAETENPDLVLLDIRMPLMDGIEVCRRIRNFSTIPIIMVTAKDSEDDKVAGLDAGADDYLTKPFGAPELMARVRAVLRRFRCPECHNEYEAARFAALAGHEVSARGSGAGRRGCAPAPAASGSARAAPARRSGRRP